MINPAAPFFDTFTYWLGAACLIVAAVDWFLGKERRGRIRDAVGMWWLYVEDTSFGKSSADISRRLVRKLTPRSLFDLVWFPLVGLQIAALFALIWFFFLSPPWHDLADGQEGYDQRVLIFSIVIGLVTGIIGAILLIVILEIFESTETLVWWMISIVASAIYIVIVLSLSYVSVPIANWIDFEIRPIFFPDIYRRPEYQSTMILHYFGRNSIIRTDDFVSYAAFVTTLMCNLVPISMLVGWQTLFLGSKAFRFALQPLTSLILKRLYESEKGVLSVFAAGGGALAKAIQEATKFFAA